MLDRVRKHIEDRLESAQLERLPFPHLIIENFFPDDVFERLLQYNPFQHDGGDEWLTRNQSKKMKTNTPYHARKQINFHQDRTFDAPQDQQEFWNDIKTCFLGDHWFEQVVLKKYYEYFVLRFGELIESDDFFDNFRKELFLQRHEPGYYIGPHTDIPTRVFTCIFSFAAREGFEQFGTELSRHKDPLVRCWGNDHYAPEDFEVAKVAPYRPNNFLLFFKTRQSFHAVRAIDDTVPNQRYGMQFQFYEPPGGVFKDLSEPNLVCTRHQSDGWTLRSALRKIRSAIVKPAKAA